MVPNGDSNISLISQKGNILNERGDHMLDVGKIKSVNNTDITRHNSSVLFYKDPVSALFKNS